MKLFLDDVRDPPDDTWVLCRWPIDVIDCMMMNDDVDIISLDHDLGHPMLTGMNVLDWIEEKTFIETNWTPPIILIHSANPVAVERMVKVVKRIYYEFKA